MFSTFLALTFLFLMFMWSLAWVNYYNKLDKDLVHLYGDGVMIIQ